MTGSSTEGIKTVLHPVSDLAKAKPVYAALLGVAPSAYWLTRDGKRQLRGPSGCRCDPRLQE